jgi:hypothetical protein
VSCLAEVIADMYNHMNPDLKTHAPIIAEDIYRIVMTNADVCLDTARCSLSCVSTIIVVVVVVWIHKEIECRCQSRT